MTTQNINRDALTGLVNRREFERNLRATLAAAHEGAKRHVMCFLDLDGFKAVNDACGHDGGDRMLVEIAEIIRSKVCDLGVVARLGGDEFGILLADCSIANARAIADGIVREVASYRFTWNDNVLSVGVSIGLVDLSRESGSVVRALGAAETACELAKEQGNHVKVYSEREGAAILQRNRVYILQWLERVLDEGYLVLDTRPSGLADAQSNNVPALEVTLRFKHESGTTDTLRDFLRAAEDRDLMPLVDRWLVQTALGTLGRTSVNLPAGQSLIIRLSGQSLDDVNVLQFVLDCIDRTGVAPSRLCFVVPKDALSPDRVSAHEIIRELRAKGCAFEARPFPSLPV